MPRAIVLWLTCLCLTGNCQSQSLFTVSATKVAVGDTIAISWDFPGAQEVYISMVGSVSSRGTQKLAMDVTTVFDAVVDYGDNQKTYSTTVKVEGARAGESCPASDAFGPDFSYTLPEIRYIKSLSVIHRLLQDSLGLPISKEFNVGGEKSRFAFETYCGSPAYILSDKDLGDGIAERRIAYSIQLEGKGTGIEIIIKSAIQYRRRAIKTWRNDNSTDLHGLEAKRIKEFIVQSSKRK